MSEDGRSGNGSDPYRRSETRCEEHNGNGKRCILPIKHRGMHIASGGDCWVRAGDSGTAYPGGEMLIKAGDK